MAVQHVLWIGGPPGSGKTSVATRLARRHGLRLSSADTRTWIHRDRALTAGSAAARRFEDLSPVDRWAQPTEDLVAMSLHVERTQMVVDDVRALPTAPLIVAEGTPVRPSLLATEDVARTQAVWLLPTEDFQEQQLAARATPDGHARLYRRLGALIAHEADEHDAPVEVVDGSRPLEAMIEIVEARFADILAAGPLAESVPVRRRLLAEANRAIADQVGGFHARSWAEGDADSVIRQFVCECGDPACDAVVTVTVGEALAGPVLAHRRGTPDRRPRRRG